MTIVIQCAPTLKRAIKSPGQLLYFTGNANACYRHTWKGKRQIMVFRLKIKQLGKLTSLIARRVLPRVVFLVSFIGIGNAHQAGAAEPFNKTFVQTLEKVCFAPSEGPGSIRLGSNLGNLCRFPDLEGPFATAGGVGFSGQPSETTTIQQRLQSIREPEEEKKPEGAANPGAYALNSGDRQLQLPPAAGGPSPGIALELRKNIGIYFTSGAYFLNHNNNRFEEGYDSVLPTVTVGGDYRINDWLLAGLAFNYTNFDGEYNDGGGFNKNTYGPLLYTSFLPFRGAFTDLVIGYARQENFNKRTATTVDVSPFISNTTGTASANYPENQYTASMRAGYDHRIENFTVGPRLGLAFAYWQIDSFKEHGNTGLELRYSELNQTSLQSSLGVSGSVAISTPYGSVVPQVSVAWVHEFEQNARNIEAQLVEATPSPTFTFARESPARNAAAISAVISTVIGESFQPFVTFSTVQGDENFVIYGGTIGLRKVF